METVHIQTEALRINCGLYEMCIYYLSIVVLSTMLIKEKEKNTT